MNIRNEDAPHQPHQQSFMRPSQTSAARRLQRSRENLGHQRHDLLVAMRVVNTIEREVVQAEFENWLLEENVRCKHLGAILRQNNTEVLAEKNGNGQHVMMDGGPRRLEETRTWQQQYCQSCKEELENVVM